MKRLLFIDRDGVICKEPHDQQIDSIEKLIFLPGMFYWLGQIVKTMDFTLVMVTNQDGLGSATFSEHDFWPLQKHIERSLYNEGIIFDQICIDRTRPEDLSPNRKPGIGMLDKYVNGAYDLAHSYVIGDRYTDMQMAANLGCSGILLNGFTDDVALNVEIALRADSWQEVYSFLWQQDRRSKIVRNTSETSVELYLNLDGTGQSSIATGLHFFDHMLTQISRHSNMDLILHCKGDLWVDEHHTIEDTALALGSALQSALAKKAGIQRYGFTLPMDDAQCQVLIDLGGRPHLEWDVTFTREKLGDVPTEMFFHFFKSLTDASLSNIHIQARGINEHHKIESIFKAFGSALKMAKHKYLYNMSIPSTKGII